MIDRYTRPRMSAIWDIQHKYEIWLEVELQACAAFEREGQIPRGISARIRKKAIIDVARIAEIEKVTKHDVIAFLESLMGSVGPATASSTWVDLLRHCRYLAGGANDRSAGSDPLRSRRVDRRLEAACA